MGWSCTWYGQHARLAADAICAHLRIKIIRAGITIASLAFKTPMYPDGAISLLDLTEQVNGVAHVDEIVIGEGHNLWQYFEFEEGVGELDGVST